MAIHEHSVVAPAYREPHPRRNCPLCEGTNRRLVSRVREARGVIDATFELVQCLDCELVFITPQLGDADLAQLYEEDFYVTPQMRCAGLGRQVVEGFQSLRRKRVGRFVTSGRLLDIGCGDGSFAHHMARHGWSATGIDFSAAAVELARRDDSGAVILHGSLSDVAFAPGSFDLITLWQVFEHIGEPRALLRRCRTLLRRGGVLVIAVPNIESFTARLTGERWWGLDVPRHLVHYSPRTLRRSLESAAFRVASIDHHSLQYDPYALLHSSLDWVFTRRHFLSDFAKRATPADMSALEYAYNAAALALLAPPLAPLCVAASVAASALERGGFIEAVAVRA